MNQRFKLRRFLWDANVHWETQNRLVWNQQECAHEEQELVYEVKSASAPRAFREFTALRICKNTGRQACYSEIIERQQVKRTPSGKYGENSGDPVLFWSDQSSKMQIR